jgi:hypothetical protein
MAAGDKEVLDFPAHGAFADADVLYIIQGGNSRQTPLIDALLHLVRREVKEYTGSITLVVGDAGNFVIVDSASPATITIPTNASVPLANGTMVTVIQAGAGLVSVIGDTGVSVNGVATAFDLGGQYAQAFLFKRTADAWLLEGNLA